MAVTKSEPLTLTFTIERQGEEGWPWLVTLLRIEPKGTGMGGYSCAYCGQGNPHPRHRICEACAVEEFIHCLGPEEWLKQCDPRILFGLEQELEGAAVPVHRICLQEGELVVTGFNEVWCANSPDGDDWDEQFHVTGSEFKEKT